MSSLSYPLLQKTASSSFWQRLLSWVTLERAAYVALAALAFVLRLTALGRTPFAPAEAAQATTALDLLINRYTLLPAGASPLLSLTQWLLFLLASANETLARLAPALAGSFTVALVYSLRAELGRIATLSSAALLAISAGLVFVSRQATGDSLALLAGMGLLTALAAQRRGQRHAALGLAAAGAGLLLTAPLAYSLLLCLLPVMALALWPAQREQSTAHTPWPKATLAFVLILLAGGTGLFFMPGGLAAVAELPAVWLRSFAVSSSENLAAVLLRFVLFEPLTLIVGLAGLWLGVRRGHWLMQGVALALLLAGLLLAVRAGRTVGDLAVLSWLLALAGGQAIAAFVRMVYRAPLRGDGLALWLGALVILAASAVWLSQLTEAWQNTLPMPFLASVIATLIIFCALLGIYGMAFGSKATLPVLWAILLSAGLLLGLRGVALTSHNADPRRWGSYASVTGAEDGRDLREALERIAMQRGSDLRDLPVAYVVTPGVAASPLLRWYGRGVRVQPLAVETPDLVVLAMAEDAQALPVQAQLYSGESFRVAQQWSPLELRGAAWLRWLCYAEYGTPQQQRAVIFAGKSPQ